MEVIAKNNMMGKKQVSEMKPVKEIKAEQMEMGIESRLLEEVKAAVFLAKQFPRDEIKAENKILELCKRKNFANTALYSFPRGGEVVQGLTIRFAEAVARAWGNIQYSVIELDTDDGKSTMLAYAWDVENNIKTTKQFDVSMKRYTKKGVYVLTDMRDQYEMKASYGARFLRGCILNLIPNYILDSCIEEIKITMEREIESIEDISQAKEQILIFLENKLNLSKQELENFLNCPYESWTSSHLVNLKLAYNGIKEGQLKISDLKEVTPVSDITEEQIQELLKLDKQGILLMECKRKYNKVLLERLNNKEYEELKELLTSK